MVISIQRPTKIVIMILFVIFSQSKSQSNNFASNFKSESNSPIVELEMLDYFVEDNRLIIYWITSAEVNSFIFEVERQSIDLNRWERRGYTVASGTSIISKNYFFFEEDPVYGFSLYRLKLLYIDGNFEYSKSLQIEYEEGVINLDEILTVDINLDKSTSNIQYPNASIQYSIPRESMVELSIYKYNGELLAVYEKGIIEEGKYSINWIEENYSSGIYLLRMTAETLIESKKFLITKKMILLK